MDRVELIQSLAAGLASLEPPHPLRVAIDGVDGAGTTTLADELATEIERLGRPVVRDAREPAEANAVVIVDDCFLHRPETLATFDFTVFVHVDGDVGPDERRYLDEVHPERLASLVINNNDPARPFVDRPEKMLPRWAQIAAGIVVGIVALVCFGGSIALMFLPNANNSAVVVALLGAIMVAVSGWVLARCVQLLAGRPQAGGWLTPMALHAAAWMFLVFAVFGLVSGYVAEHLPVSAFQVIVYVSLFFGLRRLAGRRSQRIASRPRAK
ncbi:MAG TPA: hypothetical protein VJN96_02395 [Vicinamibacterales bacterium]|nr:hypothetical protein [Vicinamibacterales bacterium]